MLTERVHAVFSRQIRCVSFFWGVKQSQTNSLVVQLNFGFPTLVFLAYACVARFIVFAFSVLRIFCVCRFSQVAQTIVSAIIVNVVKLMRGPHPMRIQPRQPMSGVQHVIHANANVTVVHSAPRRIAGAATPSGFVPCKFARIRVVVNQFTKLCLSKLFGAHGLHNIKQAGDCQA